MKAQDLQLTQLLQGAKQFIVPIFQRTYSWETQQCEQLINDILRVGADSSQHAHFIGSVVYVADDDHSANIPRWQVIDGQQRLTTLTLLLIAFVHELQRRPDAVAGISVAEVEDYYLKNRYGQGELKYKMLLTQKDRDTLMNITDGKPAPSNSSENILENFSYFCERIANEDLGQVYKGFRKLMIVDVALSRSQDDPQMIFESLNSTGMDLSQSDLIRNFVLMRQSPDEQVRLYKEIWYPMEQLFGSRFRADFDRFARDYLTLRTRPSRPIKVDDVYYAYKRYFHGRISRGDSAETILQDFRKLAEYFVRYHLGKEADEWLKISFHNLRQLVEVASPLVMGLYEQYNAGRLSIEDFVDLVSLAESYVFRRSLCGMQTRNLGQIFSSLAFSIREDNPAESIQVEFARFAKNRRFPSDAEFHECLVTRDIYDMRNSRFLLDRLENDSKEKIDTSNFTIEHIMPQNQNLSKEWREILGSDWEDVWQVWLHRLGNLTLTGYNEKYSDRPFLEKKRIQGGFDDSPLRLNKFIREQATWNQALMEQRGKILAKHALQLWAPLNVDVTIVQRYRLAEKKDAARELTLDKVDGLDGNVRELYEDLQGQLLAFGNDVTEILSKKNITFYVYEYFVHVLPRSNRLVLLLNLDFEEIMDDEGVCRDASKKAYFVGATVTGGVFIPVWSKDDMGKAMPYLRQAYEKASE